MPRHIAAVSEQMKAWSAALEAELIEWPRLSGRSMFGFNALYRGKRIFAVVPRTRGMGTPTLWGSNWRPRTPGPCPPE